MVLGKLTVPGRPTILITVGQGPIALAVGAGGVVWTFLLSSILSLLSPSPWETARYRLKYCLKGPLNPKQPTNQPTQISGPHEAIREHPLNVTRSVRLNCCGSVFILTLNAPNKNCFRRHFHFFFFTFIFRRKQGLIFHVNLLPSRRII